MLGGVRKLDWTFRMTITGCFKQEEADEAYHKKVEENEKAAEERTAKKRAKR